MIPRLLETQTELRALVLLLWLLPAVVTCGSGSSEFTQPIGVGAPAGWPTYGGDAGGSRFSPLDQIHRGNVGRLRVAWTYRTGDWPGARSDLSRTTFQATPILDAGTLYLCSPANRIFALDAETGAERWIFDAKPSYTGGWSRTCRGVALWRAAAGVDAGGDCSRRVFMGTMDARLVAVDADTGLACADFGEGGSVDLLAGLGDVHAGETYMTSPPTVVGDVVVTAALVADNRRVDSPGGVIRGFDVRTGRLRWFFDPVPPGTEPLAPADDGSPRFHRGTPNAWSILSADPLRGLVFVPFGAASPDFYGGERAGFDHYANAVVALDAATGEPVWRFQAVHHGLWDYDLPSQPMLIDVVVDGVTRAAVAQATKMGHIFLLDRATGEPLYPIEERPVPPSFVPGEVAAPTQPFPTFPEPVHPHRIDSADVFGITPLDRHLCRRALARHRNEGIFTPPSFEGTVHYPGTAGGMNWGSMAWDPERRLLVMTQNRIAQVLTLIPRGEMPGLTRANRPRGISLQEGTPYYIRTQVLSSPLGVPCSPLPWGTLVAVDLETGRKRWEIPFGTTRDLVPLPFAMNFGLPSMGGPILTAAGLVFIGASLDDYLRAYDVETGEKLLEIRLPAGAQATPMTYRLREDGRQYVVIAVGGHSTLGTTLGDYVMAFSLP
ncbi:MAG: pyrroloquinoline quinone-dependent dehydrogenase [Deltaproteobacteria bacterium]|nr:pyrroloquinoline quinone-dependent dehydrogenase [Deltaproteobacteria bacterium]